MNDTIKIPVVGRMQKQPDGSWKMVEAEYIETTADAVARFLLEKFRVPVEPLGEAKS